MATQQQVNVSPTAPRLRDRFRRATPGIPSSQPREGDEGPIQGPPGALLAVPPPRGMHAGDGAVRAFGRGLSAITWWALCACVNPGNSRAERHRGVPDA